MILSEWLEFPLAHCLGGGGLDDSLCLDVLEIAHIPHMLLSLFPFGWAKDLSAPWYTLYSTNTI